MRFAILPALCLIGSTFAAPTKIEARDLTVISYNIKRVNDAMTLLDQALSRRPGLDANSMTQYFQGALQINQQVSQELRAGAQEIRKGPSINDFEALQLTGQVAPLLNTINKVVNGWIAVKRQAVQVNAHNAILDALIQGEIEAGAFSDAMISKLGFISQAVGSGLKSSINSAVERAVVEYRKK